MVTAARDSLRAGVIVAIDTLLHIMRHADSDETRRKACNDIIQVAGVDQPGWGSEIGPTDAAEVAARRKREENSRALINSLGF
jgi:hypothetical protein